MENKDITKEQVTTPENEIELEGSVQQEEVTEPVIEKRNTIDDIEIKSEEWNAEKSKPAITIPTKRMKDTTEYLEAIDSKFTADSLKEHFSEKDFNAIAINSQAVYNSLPRDVYEDSLDNEDNEYINRINYADKNLVPNTLKISSKTNVVSNQLAVALFSKSLGIGEFVEVPLWHSGFWVTLRPPKQSELIILESNIASLAIKLGALTNTIIYSNYSVIANRMLAEFIKEHIQNTSLKLPPDEDILKHINIQDFQALVLGLVSSMFPKGTPITRSCSNTTVLTDNSTPKCDYTVTGTIDPKKLLFVNRSALKPEHLDTMSKRIANSVSLDEVKNYQMSLDKIQPQHITLDTEVEDVKVKFLLSLPSVFDYISAGEIWVNDIITRTEALFTKADTNETKNNKVNEMLSTFILGIYSTFIKEIELPDKKVIDGPSIITLLEVMSSDNEILKNYIGEVTKFITNTAVSIVATPTYTCPKCKEEQKGSDNKDFNYLIPLNMVDTFFALSTLRTQKVNQLDRMF